MGQLLKNVVAFTNVAAAGQATLPHGLNVQDHGVVPDEVKIGNADFSFVSANATSVTVQNNGAAPASCDVLVEHWHTVERSFGELATGDETALNPQPFVTVTGNPTAGGGGGGFVPQGGPDLAGVAPAVRSGRAVFVNPADPTAADDGDWATPKLTITGAIAAIVAAGPPTDVSTSLMRWTMYVAPGCYDEDVTIPPEITRLTMVSMGGVTLGDGIASAYGTSTTPRNLTIQASDDYKFFLDAFNNPLPPSAFVLTTLTENFTGWNPQSYVGFGNAATTDYSMFGWRISGNFVLTQAGGVYQDYEDVFPLTLNSVVVEGDFDASGFGAPANPYYYLENCFFYGGWNGGAAGTLHTARMCLFGSTGTATFYSGGPPRLIEKCTFSMDAIDFGAGGGDTYLNETTLNAATLFAWPNTLRPDRYTLKSIHALGRTIAAYATSQAIIPNEEPSVLVFGNTDIGAAAGTVYLTPGFQAAAAGATDDKQIPLSGPSGIVITNFIVRHNLTPGANNVTYELLSNGAPLAQAITTTLSAGGAGPATSTGKPAFVADGSRLSVRAVKPGGGIVSGALNVTVLVYFYPV